MTNQPYIHPKPPVPLPNAPTPAGSATRHGITGLLATVCVAGASYYGVPEVVSVPVCTALAGFLGGLLRRVTG